MDERERESGGCDEWNSMAGRELNSIGFECAGDGAARLTIRAGPFYTLGACAKWSSRSECERESK